MINYVPKLGGWRPAAANIPRQLFADNLTKFPIIVPNDDIVDCRKWCSPVEDQGHVGSCVGNGVVGALEFLQIYSGMPAKDLSRLFVYYNARLMTRDQDKDGGAYIHLAFSTLSSLGTCSESQWAYDVTKVFVRPDWNAYREAFANKIDSYYSIGGGGDTRIDFIKRALRAHHVVVFGMTVDQEYMDYSSGVVTMPPQVRVNSGGHCQVIVGYDDSQRLFIVRNSWGTGWGDGGYAWLPYAYLDASDANDFWVPTAISRAHNVSGD